MKKKFSLKNITIVILLLLILFQFVRIDKTNPPLEQAKDIISITKPSEEISSILKISCYDCHSNEITYPWYTNIAPVSWWIKHHINEGTHHLNFSEWGNYSSRKADHKLKECVEMVEEGEMPMFSYTLMHGEAKLSKEQQLLLINWFKSLRTHESDKPKENK
jgi:hypothetical protein